MFLKKSLLFTTALALLMFAGQASAQGVSFTHVTDGTAGMASGTDAIVVELEVTGVPLPPVASYTIGFDYPDFLTLSSAVDGNGDNIVLLGTVSKLNNPPAVSTLGVGSRYVYPNVRCNGSWHFPLGLVVSAGILIPLPISMRLSRLTYRILLCLMPVERHPDNG